MQRSEAGSNQSGILANNKYGVADMNLNVRLMAKGIETMYQKRPTGKFVSGVVDIFCEMMKKGYNNYDLWT